MSMTTKFLGFIGRVGARRVLGNSKANATHSFSHPAIRRAVATLIFVMFPTASDLTERDWLELFARLETYFTPRLNTLLEVITRNSIENHGLIKLCKIVFGTIHKRTQVREHHEPDRIDFIYNTLRLAYSWGITYPLVDNILDSPETSLEVRSLLATVLRELFATNGSSPQTAVPLEKEFAIVSEVRERLTEVISLIPIDLRSDARITLGHLLVAHHRDAQRRLSTPSIDVEDLHVAVMVDSILKAALIRLATIQVAGIPMDEATTIQHFTHSLFNQLGDDIWDIYEDYVDDRVTPCTLFLVSGGDRNPFDFYFAYLKLLAKGKSKRRRTAILMGFCETLRDALLATEQRSDDPLRVTQAILDSLKRFGGLSVPELIRTIPHVDTDAVLFAFKNALLAFVKSGSEVQKK